MSVILKETLDDDIYMVFSFLRFNTNLQITIRQDYIFHLFADF